MPLRALTITPTQALTTEFTCAGISFIFVVLRLYVRVHTRFSAPSTNPWYQDVLIALAWICSLGNAVVDTFANKNGMWNPGIAFKINDSNPPIEKYITDPVVLVRELKILFWTEPLYFLALFSVKMSFLLMYQHLFPPNMKKLRTAMYATMGLVVFGYGLIMGLSQFWCLPIEKNWALKMEDRCLAWGAIPPYLFATGFNILSDLVIYSLPFFLLPTLYRSSTTRQFVGVIACFSLGLLCIICTTCRIIIVGSGAPVPYIGTWLAAEMATAIIAACAPPLRWFWANRVRRHSERNKEVAVAPRGKHLWSQEGDATGGSFSLFARTWKSYRSSRSRTHGTTTGTVFTARRDGRTVDSTEMSMTGTRASIYGNEGALVNALAPRHNGNPMVFSGVVPEKLAGEIGELAILDHIDTQPQMRVNSHACDAGISVPILRESQTAPKKKSMWRKWKKQRLEQARRKAELGNLTFGGANQQSQMKTISEMEEGAGSSNRYVGKSNLTWLSVEDTNSPSRAGFGFLHGQSFIRDDDATTTYSSSDEHWVEINRREDQIDLEYGQSERNNRGVCNSFYIDDRTSTRASVSGSCGPKSVDGDDEDNEIGNLNRISFISDAFGKRS